jgi:hypothetical protein
MEFGATFCVGNGTIGFFGFFGRLLSTGLGFIVGPVSMTGCDMPLLLVVVGMLFSFSSEDVGRFGILSLLLSFEGADDREGDTTRPSS